MHVLDLPICSRHGCRARGMSSICIHVTCLYNLSLYTTNFPPVCSQAPGTVLNQGLGAGQIPISLKRREAVRCSLALLRLVYCWLSLKKFELCLLASGHVEVLIDLLCGLRD
jgi:hypothetical protein